VTAFNERPQKVQISNNNESRVIAKLELETYLRATRRWKLVLNSVRCNAGHGRSGQLALGLASALRSSLWAVGVAHPQWLCRLRNREPWRMCAEQAA